MNRAKLFPMLGRDNDQTKIGVLLDRRRSATIEEFVDRHYLWIAVAISSALILLAILLTRQNTLTTPVTFGIFRNFPGFMQGILWMIFALSPKGKLSYAIVGFFALYLTSIALQLNNGSLVPPKGVSQTAFLLTAFVYNLILGLGIGMIIRPMAQQLTKAPFELPYDAALLASMMLGSFVIGLPSIMTFLFLGIVPLWGLDNHPTYVLAIHQILFLSSLFPMLVLCILYPVGKSDIWRIGCAVLALCAIALLEYPLGLQTERSVSLLFCLAMRVFMPVNTAVYATFLGLFAQRILIGDNTPAHIEDFLVFSTSFFLLSICDIKILSDTVRTQQIQSFQDHIRGVNQSSRSGYYMYSKRMDRVWTDEVLQAEFAHPFLDPSDAMMRRLHPDDAVALENMWSQVSEGPQELTLRVCDDRDWSEDAGHRIYQITNITISVPDRGHMSIGNISEITEFKVTSDALSQTMVELKISKEHQHRMFSLISHELRTPAAILKMLSQQMDEGSDWDEMGSRFSSVLTQLLTLMDDMGNVIRDQDLSTANISVFNPNDLLNRIAAVFRIMAEDAGLSIDLRISQKFNQPRLIDVGRLQQILGNLIRNAVLHSGGNHVVLSYREQIGPEGHGTEGVWTIEDNGKGIPPELLPGLFEAFNRQTRGVYSTAEGTGLGMYIIKLLTTNMGGQISYQPSNLGGAKFTLTLPLEHGADCPEQTKDATSEARHKDKSVLLVEDNELVAEITQTMLRKYFSNVLRVSTAEGLLERYRDLAPDLILADVHLPRMDGKTMIRSLRENGFDGTIVGLSAAAISEDEGKELGMQGVLSKPLMIEALMVILDDVETARSI